jgi:uncharacterized membrane protein
MDFHPIIVHFPVALLTLYAILEIFNLKILTRQTFYAPLKGVLVMLGTLGAMVALQTGEEAAEFQIGPLTGGPFVNLIQAHAFWATLTTWIFSLLAIAYLLGWLKEKLLLIKGFGILKKLIALILGLQKLILQTPLKYLLALLGLISITITGALGGALVYGPNVDPLVKIIYRLLVK